MGMTIAEPIQTLEYLRDSGVFPFSTKEGVLYTVTSIDIAIETMRKYQKIREIAFPLQFCTTDKLNHEAIMKICEVLEDGNN